MSSKPEITEAQFFEMVDRYIAQVNESAQRFGAPPAGTALLYAAARFNAFNWMTRSEQTAQTVEEATTLFSDEYRKMFRDNVANLQATRLAN